MGEPLTVPRPGIDELPVRDPIDYVQALWMRIADRQHEAPSPGWHREEVREASRRHRETPSDARPWTQVRAELEVQLKRS